MSTTKTEIDVTAQRQEAVEFLGLFEKDDTLCITFIHSTESNEWGEAVTQNKFGKMSYYISPRGLAALQKRNDEGWHVYVSMQPFKGGSRERLLENVSTVRHAFIDLDATGDESLKKVREAVAAGLVPQPAFIVESSPGRYHVEWNVEDLNQNEARALNESLLKMFNGDEHCKDVARVLRIPGFVNCKPKYGPNFPVARIVERGTNDIYSLAHFRIPVEVIDYNIEGEDGPRIEFDEARFQSIVDEELAGPPIYNGKDKIPSDAAEGSLSGHDGTLFNIASRLRHYAGDEEHIYEALVEICESRCLNYGSDYKDMCRAKAHNVCERYDVGTQGGKPTLKGTSGQRITNWDGVEFVLRVFLDGNEIDASGKPIAKTAYGVEPATLEVASSEGSAAPSSEGSKAAATPSVEDEPLPDFTSTLTGSIADYARAIEPDFPMEFKVMAAVTKIGLALSGRCFMRNGSDRLQPRFYTCLIALSAWGKSGSIGTVELEFSGYDEIFSLDSAPALVTTFRERYVHMHPAANKETVDAAVNSKGCEPLRVILLPDEMKDVFEKAKASKEAKGNIGTYLLRLMEGNECSNNTKADGNIQIRSAHLAMLGGATPEGYDAMWMNTAGAMGGLQSRMTPVGTNNPMPPQKRRGSNDDVAAAAKVRIFEQVRKANGEIHVTPDAEAMLDSWWETVKLLDGSARVSDIVRRYLIVLAVTNDTTIVNEFLTACGIAFGNHVLAMRSKHNPSDATSPVQAMENRILKAYEKWGAMSERDVSRKIHPERFAGGYSAFNVAMSSLQSAGVLEQFDTTGITKKRRWVLAA